jgi:hypothetical protein
MTIAAPVITLEAATPALVMVCGASVSEVAGANLVSVTLQQFLGSLECHWFLELL